MKKQILLGALALIITTCTHTKAPTIKRIRNYTPNHNLFYPETFSNHATAWVNTYVFNQYGSVVPSYMELQYIANLMYYSYRRSVETMEAQKAALRMINGSWRGWQNIAKRRLNPSTPPPYKINIEREMNCTEQFWRLYAQQQRINSAYDTTVSHVVHGTALTTQTVKNGVETMRTEARKVMLDALTDIKQHLGNLFDYAFNKSFKSDSEIRRGIADFVLSYVPQLAVHSFVHADKLHNTVTDETWHMLRTVQEIGVQTWQAIEQARSAFYKAHYSYLYQTMQRLQLPSTYFAILFDENGVIPPHSQKIMLPDPTTL